LRACRRVLFVQFETGLLFVRIDGLGFIGRLDLLGLVFGLAVFLLASDHGEDEDDYDAYDGNAADYRKNDKYSI
jgi:hypothetical protein